MPPEVAREVVLAACRDRSTRWVAVVGARSGITREDLRTLGFADAELPPGLAERVADRRVLVLERRE